MQGMVQPRSTHKSDRAQIMARPDPVDYDVVRERSGELEVPIGQYVADVLTDTSGAPS